MANTTIKQSQVRGLVEALNGKQATLTAGNGITIIGNTISADISAAITPFWISTNGIISEVPVTIPETTYVESYVNGLLMRPANGTPGQATYSAPSSEISNWKALSAIDFVINNNDVTVPVDFSSLEEGVSDLGDVVDILDQAGETLATDKFGCLPITDDQDAVTGFKLIPASAGGSSSIHLNENSETYSAASTAFGEEVSSTGTGDGTLNDYYLDKTNKYVIFADVISRDDNVCFKVFGPVETNN